MVAGPVVDTPSAQEFQREILGRIAAEELQAIAADLDRKSRMLRDLLLPEPARFDRFSEMLAAYPGPGFDLPAELLHFSYPDRYWLWTRWLWDPRSETAALGLVTTDDVDLTEGATRGAIYLTVGRAIAFADETGKAA